MSPLNVVLIGLDVIRWALAFALTLGSGLPSTFILFVVNVSPLIAVPYLFAQFSDPCTSRLLPLYPFPFIYLQYYVCFLFTLFPLFILVPRTHTVVRVLYTLSIYSIMYL